MFVRSRGLMDGRWVQGRCLRRATAAAVVSEAVVGAFVNVAGRGCVIWDRRFGVTFWSCLRRLLVLWRDDRRGAQAAHACMVGTLLTPGIKACHR